ncbi:MAG: 50S ribosomal protein L29 [Acidiferrobacterales bacterium]
MKVSELRNLDSKALQQELEGLSKEQFNLRMQTATQQLANTAQLTKVRKDIARVKTVMNELIVGKAE